MLIPLFDQRQDLGNFLRERILYGFLQGNTAEEILSDFTSLLEHFSSIRRD